MTSSFRTELLAVVLMLAGDGMLRLLSLAAWPVGVLQWQAVVVKPEAVNAVVTVLLLAALRQLPNYPSGAWMATSALALGIVTTLVHRWILGSVFPLLAMLMTGIIFAALALLCLTLAHQWTAPAKEL